MKKGALVLILLFVLLCLWAHITNPFINGIYKSPYITRINSSGVIELVEVKELSVSTFLPLRLFAFFKSAYHIVFSRVFAEEPLPGSVNRIVASLYAERFNPDTNPFLISGGHFSVLYPRNLAVFYQALLDPYTALTKKDWENRQRVYLQSAALAIDAFEKCGDSYTTIVPVSRSTVTCINIYNPASDALYGVLYSLQMLQNNQELIDIYHDQINTTPYRLTSVAAARELQKKHESGLWLLTNRYIERVYDKKTGLVKKDVALSSAKDASVRQSSFYDNVIFWKTLELADKLGIRKAKKSELMLLKRRIITAFWLKDHFLEDLSAESARHKLYSSDWLFVIPTGFLRITDPADREYIEKSIEYVKRHKIDEPLPISYQLKNRPNREIWWVRTFASSYGGEAVWSYWGTEYIKTLILLSTYDKQEYRKRAQKYIASYDTRIKKYGGFSEVYDRKGDLFVEGFYRSVRRMGWVVSLEQARSMFGRKNTL